MSFGYICALGERTHESLPVYVFFFSSSPILSFDLSNGLVRRSSSSFFLLSPLALGGSDDDDEDIARPPSISGIVRGMPDLVGVARGLVETSDVGSGRFDNAKKRTQSTFLIRRSAGLNQKRVEQSASTQLCKVHDAPRGLVADRSRNLLSFIRRQMTLALDQQFQVLKKGIREERIPALVTSVSL